MRIRKLSYISIAFLAIALVVAVYRINDLQMTKPNHAEVNDFIKTIEGTGNTEEIKELKKQYGLNYYYQDGKLVVYSDYGEKFQEAKQYAILTLVLFAVIAVIIIVIFFLSINKNIITPFYKLQYFAATVAKGDLNVPLLMDRDNIFGAFTESFDIMREELALAKENEKRANESKKELVASLSHDIKTPLASIKAITELLLVKMQNTDIIDRLHSIDQKTEQIEVLVNNLFHATLEELEELKVILEEISSLEIKKFIKNADTNNRIEECQINECLVICDPLRLQQVLDNIISNSYKYADSSIRVTSIIEYGYLSIMIEDYGKGVSIEDLALLKKKYYRGSNSEGKNGAGIGLYISNYFMEHMEGFLNVTNGEYGFQAIVGIKIV